MSSKILSSSAPLAAPQRSEGGSSTQVRVNGRPISVPAGTVAASAIALAGVTRFRSSIVGQPRGPLCGMGICMECRATVNGRPFCRTCLIICEQDMEIEIEPA